MSSRISTATAERPSPVKLSELAVDRSTSNRSSVQRRKLVTRYVVPVLILLSFAAVFSWSLRDAFLPAQPVTVTPVMVTTARVQLSGTPMFQAAGWIEPRPTATVVSAQAEGILESLLVIEGQQVEQGEPVARLIDADARLAVKEAQTALALREAELELAHAALAAAETNFSQPVHLEAALAGAEAELARATTEVNHLPFALQAAEARMRLAQQELEGKQAAADAIAQRAVQRATTELQAAEAAVNELRERRENLQAELQSWARKRDALQKQLELKTAEHQRVQEASAGLKIAAARLEQARLVVAVAELNLSRMVVEAPVAGRVLALHAQPGQRLAGLSPSSERDASDVVSLYDPRSLQVREDVRLEDVPQTLPGQIVEIMTPVAREPLRGEVIAVTSRADIQKNTLQVKVAIHEPPPVIKPEMLVQVTFLASEQQDESEDSNAAPLRKLIPRQLLAGTQASPAVWVADLARSQARLQSVQLGRRTAGDWIEIEQGVDETTKLIVGGRENLKDGQRIKITGEDQHGGAVDSSHASALVATGSREH